MTRGRRRRGGGGQRPEQGADPKAGPKPASSSRQAGTVRGTPGGVGPRSGGPRGGRDASGASRSGRGGGAAGLEGVLGDDAPGGEARRTGSRKRRRRGAGSRGTDLLSVIEQMAAKGPRTLQTLPADGQVLEEIIGAMREEYGYPATPQEYRLILRVAPEEPERAAGRNRQSNGGPGRGPAGRSVAPVVELAPLVPGLDHPGLEDESVGDDPVHPARRPRLRRRRRGRGRGAGASGESTGSSGESAGGNDGPDAGPAEPRVPEGPAARPAASGGAALPEAPSGLAGAGDGW